MKVTTNYCQEGSAPLVPIIDLNKCESKGPCVEVCPYHVLEMKPIGETELRSLSLIGRLKTLAHGKEKAFVIDPDLCHACGLCVTACPENAIKLRRK